MSQPKVIEEFIKTFRSNPVLTICLAALVVAGMSLWAVLAIIYKVL